MPGLQPARVHQWIALVAASVTGHQIEWYVQNGCPEDGLQGYEPEGGTTNAGMDPAAAYMYINAGMDPGDTSPGDGVPECSASNQLACISG